MPKQHTNAAPIRSVKEWTQRNAVAGFEYLGVEFPSTSKTIVDVRCPLPDHDDEHPSCSVTLAGPGAGLWHCKSCNVGGSVLDLHALQNGRDRTDKDSIADAARDIAERFSIADAYANKPLPRILRPPPEPPPEAIPEGVVNQYAQALLANPDRLAQAEAELGLPEWFVGAVGIGWIDGEKRYTLPVRDAATDDVYDLRKYLAPSDRPKRKQIAKCLPFTDGRGTNTIGLNIAGGSEWMFWCEGEVDALALNAAGFPAASCAPGGAGAWAKDRPPDLTGQIIYILGDNDDSGVNHADLAPKIYEAGAALVYVVRWPDDAEEGDDPRALLLRDGDQAHEKFESMRHAANLVTPPIGREEALLRAAMPDTGWVADWLTYARAFNEACDGFLLASGLMCLAVATGRKCWLPDGDRKLFLNLYMLLVGPQSRGRKSTCVGFTKKMTQRAFEGEVIPDDWTPEAFLDALAECPRALWPVDEFSAVVEGARKDYRAGTRQLMATMYDCPATYRSSRRTQELNATVEDVFVNVAAATTPKWFMEQLRSSDVSGGLMSRFFYVIHTESGRIMPRRQKHDITAFNDLLSRIHGLRDGLGDDGRELDDSPIYEAYDSFYREVRRWATDDGDDDEGLGGFYSRIASMALKFAALYQLADDPGSTTIELPAWRRAEALATYLRQTARVIVGDVGDHKEDRAKRRIAEVIQEANGAWVTLGTITRSVGARLADSRTRKTLLDELCREGRVEFGHKGNAEAYKWVDGVDGG